MEDAEQVSRWQLMEDIFSYVEETPTDVFASLPIIDVTQEAENNQALLCLMRRMDNLKSLMVDCQMMFLFILFASVVSMVLTVTMRRRSVQNAREIVVVDSSIQTATPTKAQDAC